MPSTRFSTARKMPLSADPPSSFLVNSAFQKRLETSRVLEERQPDPARRPIALLGNDQLSLALQIGIVLFVDLFAKNKGHHVGVLLNRPRFTQICKLRAMIAAPAFGCTAQLRKRNHRHVEFLGQSL